MTSDHAEIVELVNAIFDAVDAKDWGTAQAFFAWHTRGDDAVRTHVLPS
jgi:hypothetical protein